MSTEPAAPAPVRFDCPACGAVLTVPAAAAGLQGPCPKCWQEIVSPDPTRGFPARLPAPPAPVDNPVEKLPSEPPDEVPALSPAPPARPASKAVFLGTCLLSALVFTSAGFFLGRSQRPAPEAPLASTPRAPTPPPTAAPPSLPPGEKPPPAPTPAAPEAPLSPEQALRAFLDAPDWKTRAARVLSPDEVLPKMEKHAADHGDGPIAVTAIELIQAVGPDHLFKVCTTTHPEGFWVAVLQTDEGLMIDWETFIELHDDHFKKLLDGPVEGRGEFHVLVKPEPDLPDQPNYARYRLNVPMPDRETVAWIRKDSVSLARLHALFEGSDGIDKNKVDQLVATEGIPMVLALSKRRTNDGRGYLEITDFVRLGWDPVNP